VSKKKAAAPSRKKRRHESPAVADLAGDVKAVAGHSLDMKTLEDSYGIVDANDQDEIDWVNDEHRELPPEEKLIRPFGWKLLVMPMRPAMISKGGIIIPQVRQDTDQYLSYVGRIVSMGTLAFKHPKWSNMGFRPEDAPRRGDWIIYPIYQYQRIDFRGTKLILLNDDSFLATVPEGVSPWDFKLER
jgi:co-chaperonin GroES (HSP10)